MNGNILFPPETCLNPLCMYPECECHDTDPEPMTNTPTPESPVLSRDAEALKQLSDEHARQLDHDGIESGYSRQAVHEVLASHEALRQERDEAQSHKEVAIRGLRDAEGREKQWMQESREQKVARETAEATVGRLTEALEKLEGLHTTGASDGGSGQEADWCDICKHAQADINGHADDCPFAALEGRKDG